MSSGTVLGTVGGEHTVRTRMVCVLLLLVLSFLTISGCLNAPLLNMDDNIQVTANPFLQPDRAWWEAFGSYHYSQYVPITHVSYRINAWLFGLESAWAYRLVSWLLHAAAAVVLLGTLRTLGVPRIGSLFVASVWAVHPMACESVGWVSERSTVLAFFFGILSLYCYLTPAGRPAVRWGLSVLFYALALMSKALALGWMPIFLAVEVLGGPHRLAGDEPQEAGRSVGRSAIRLLPFLILTAILCALGVSACHVTVRPPPGGSPFSALMTDLDLFARYAFNTLIPVRLSASYGVRAINSVVDPRFLGWLVFWIALMGGTIWLSSSRRRAIFGWLWFLGGLGPASNLVVGGYPMQDRYVYLSSVGLLLVLLEAADGLAQRVPRIGRVVQGHLRVWQIFLSACVLLLGGLAVERSCLWADTLALTEDAVAKQPDSALAHIFFARQLDYQAWQARLATPPDDRRSRAFSQAAVEHYQQALALPDAYLYNLAVTRILLGGSLLEAGQPTQAIAVLEKVIPVSDASPHTVRDPQETCYHVIDGPFDFPYVISFSDAGRAHQWLADAYLDEFTQVRLSPVDARAKLERSALHAGWVGRNAPWLLKACFTEAYLFLLQEVFSSSPPQEAQAAANTILKIAKPYVDAMSRVPEVLAELRSPLPEKRPNAMACLGMAELSFDAAVRPDATREEQQARCEQARAWASRAIDFDPEFSETYWFLATMHQILANKARDAKDLDEAARLQKKTAAWLSRIQPGKPRYDQARQILSRMASPGH